MMTAIWISFRPMTIKKLCFFRNDQGKYKDVGVAVVLL
jgi:hypothetical protein